MISDDTEHTCMVSQCLIESGDDVDTFTRRFASRLRWWILALPAGVGKATARSCIKLWFGVRPSKSGGYSAGNGPAMRAAIFGATIDLCTEIVSWIDGGGRVKLTKLHSVPGKVGNPAYEMKPTINGSLIYIKVTIDKKASGEEMLILSSHRDY
jgi:hypothetical protein